MISGIIYFRTSSVRNAYRFNSNLARTARLNNQKNILSSTSQICRLKVKEFGRVECQSISAALIQTRSFRALTQPLHKDPESKAEKTVNLIKENILDLKKDEQHAAAAATTTSNEAKKVNENLLKTEKVASKATIDEKIESIPSEKTKSVSAVEDASSKQIDVKRPTLWQRIVKELKHYADGFKLLYFETKIAYGLLKKVLRGETLTRRERRQFTRTSADLFRLVPFSVFIIVPFMEFTLPIFLKLFPNMLPSTFQEESKEQEKLKKRLKAKLEMAKFLQDTLEETALKADNVNTETQALNHKFAEFMKKIRSKGEQPSNEEIMKYSSLFENELTLDNLTRQQLIALCQILDVSTLGNIPPNHILRFQLRMKMRNLEADDKVIIKEGVETMTTDELQLACRERGMRAIGLTETRLRHQLEQWLDLHINRKIPLSLLLLSRAMYLPENLPPEDLIKTTISALPSTVDEATRLKVAEISGASVDNKTKLELLKQEQVQIKLENAATEAAAAAATQAEAASVPAQSTSESPAKQHPSPVPSMRPETIASSLPEKDFAEQQIKKETLVDKATVIITANEAKEIGDIIESLPKSASKQVKAEIDELKKDVDEYKEDVKEIEEMSIQSGHGATKLTETKSAKLLSKRVQKLLSEVDTLVAKIEKEDTSAPLAAGKRATTNAVSIDELMETIKRFKGASSQDKEKKLMHVLQSLDKDKDGKIDDLNDVLKVFELIEQENVQVTKDQLGKILHLLEKEKLIEMEEQKEKKEINETAVKQ